MVGDRPSLGEGSEVFEPLERRLLLSDTIQGQLWHDLDANGQHDAGETGLNGWTIELTDIATSDVW